MWRMRIIIVGAGKVGLALMEQLQKEDHEIIMIDQNPNVLQNSQESYDVMVVTGNGASMDVLQQTNVDAADLLIAVTNADEINLLCCITARKMGCPYTIARVRNPEYSKQLAFLRDDLGLSMTINPEYSAAREIFNVLQFSSFINREAFAKGRVEIVELRMVPGCVAIGMSLHYLHQDAKIKFLVCAVERGDAVYIPSGDFVLREGDKIHVTAQPQNLATLVKYLHIPNQRIRDVVILGGGRIAYSLANMLLAAGNTVKIIERNYERCVQLSTLLPKAMILNMDACQKRVLEEEIAGHADAVVSLLGIDEVNLIMCMAASKEGVSKVVAKVDRVEFMDVFDNLGVDTVISPKQLTCNKILRYVRAMQNPTKGTIITLYRLLDNRVEALEFRATEENRYIGVPLKSAPIRKSVLIACIRRRNEVIFPVGDDVIKPNDSVIVVTTADRHISNLDDIFK